MWLSQWRFECPTKDLASCWKWGWNKDNFIAGFFVTDEQFVCAICYICYLNQSRLTYQALLVLLERRNRGCFLLAAYLHMLTGLSFSQQMFYFFIRLRLMNVCYSVDLDCVCLTPSSWLLVQGWACWFLMCSILFFAASLLLFVCQFLMFSILCDGSLLADLLFFTLT